MRWMAMPSRRATTWVVLAAAGGVEILAACGEIDVKGSDGTDDPSDVTGDSGAGSMADAGGESNTDGASGNCDPAAPIVQVEPIDQLNRLPTITSHCCAVFVDERTVYFAAGSATGVAASEIFRAERTEEGFSEPEHIVGADTADDVWGPAPSLDELSLFYNHIGPSGFEILGSTRETREDPLPAGQRVDLGDLGASEADPFLAEPGLFFQRGAAIHLAPPDPELPGRFLPAQPVPGIVPTPPGQDLVPGGNQKGDILYWARDADGSGARDIWMASRSGDGYVSPQPVPEDTGSGERLNTEFVEAPSWETPDHCTLYFTTNRRGTFEIWIAHRAPSG